MSEQSLGLLCWMKPAVCKFNPLRIRQLSQFNPLRIRQLSQYTKTKQTKYTQSKELRDGGWK